MSEKPSFANRRSSLRYFKEHEINKNPSFFNDSEIEYETITTHTNKNNNASVITMKTSTLLVFLALIAILSVLFFGAGYMIAYMKYATPTQGVHVNNQAEKPATIALPAVPALPTITMPAMPALPTITAPAPTPAVTQKPAAQAQPAPAATALAKAKPPAQEQVLPEGLVVSEGPPPEQYTRAIVQAPSEIEQLTIAPKADSFAVEFGTSDNLNAANEMAHQLSGHKLIVKIKEAKDVNGRSSFKIQSQGFKTYEETYTYLHNLPQPYSVWGKIVNLNADTNGNDNATK